MSSAAELGGTRWFLPAATGLQTARGGGGRCGASRWPAAVTSTFRSTGQKSGVGGGLGRGPYFLHSGPNLDSALFAAVGRRGAPAYPGILLETRGLGFS